MRDEAGEPPNKTKQQQLEIGRSSLSEESGPASRLARPFAAPNPVRSCTRHDFPMTTARLCYIILGATQCMLNMKELAIPGLQTAGQTHGK